MPIHLLLLLAATAATRTITFTAALLRAPRKDAWKITAAWRRSWPNHELDQDDDQGRYRAWTGSRWRR